MLRNFSTVTVWVALQNIINSQKGEMKAQINDLGPLNHILKVVRKLYKFFSILRHKKYDHNVIRKHEKEVVCDLCGKFLKVRSMENHMETHHSGNGSQ